MNLEEDGGRLAAAQPDDGEQVSSTTGPATETLPAASSASATGTSLSRPRDPMEAPVRKLTVHLLQTYKRINEVYYVAKAKKKKQSAKPKPWDDKDNNYIAKKNEIFASRYRIQKKIGKGSFGIVIAATEISSDTQVAIKIIKGHKAFAKQAQIEIKILEYLRTRDIADTFGIVRLLGHFVHRNHVCLVFEMLSCNLYDLLKNTQFRGVSLSLIRKFARQLLQTLVFLAEQNVIHCDLKPENILLVSPTSSRIKVIDFGSSCFGDQQMYKYIQSRFYRSPEVILGISYCVAIDMWSLGCILVEMHTGQPVFNGRDESHHMHMIVDRLGFPPESVMKKAHPTKLAKLTGFGVRVGAKVKPSKSLETFVGVTTGGPQGRRLNAAGHSEADYRIFVDFIKQMLCYDPDARITPRAALKHPFFAVDMPPASTAASDSTPSPSTTSDASDAHCDASTQTNKRVRTDTDNTNSPAEKGAQMHVEGGKVPSPHGT